jgi:cobalt-zinc-cadmium efflux system outer membrane protein
MRPAVCTLLFVSSCATLSLPARGDDGAFSFPVTATATVAGQENPPPLTLEAALVIARDRAPQSGAARERATGARQAAESTPRWLNPSLEVRTENWGSSADLPLDSFVLLTQPLEVSGTRGARVHLAEADRDEADAAARDAQQLAMREAARLYLDALRARDVLAFTREQAEGLREIVVALGRRVREGVAAEADLRKFEAELAQVDTNGARMQIELDRGVALLAARLSTPSLTASQLLTPSPPPPVRAVSDAELETAIDRVAPVVLARTRHERALRAEALERARGRPDIVVSGGYKRTAEANTGVAAVLVPIPLTDRNQPAQARATAESRATALELESARAMARAVARALLAEATLLQSRASAGDATLVQPATTVRQAARASFREGAFDPLRLVDAERAWTEARRTNLALQLDAVLASIDVRLALGEEVVP